MEHALTRTAAENDADFLARVTRSWAEALDQDGAEPSEELLRQLQGAFLRKPRHGLQHLEIFATTDQFEHLITVMNTATNPRTGARHRPGRHRPHGAGRTGARSAAAWERGAGSAAAAALGPADGARPRSRQRTPRCRPWTSAPGRRSCSTAWSARAKRPSPPEGCPPRAGSGPRSWPPSTTATCSPGSGRLPPKQAPLPTPHRRHRNQDGTGTLLFTGPVTAGTIRKIACDADIIPVVLGGEGQILDIGRASRVFPPHIRKAITARDRGCAFPQCTIPAPWCEAHHITYWSRGGTTGTGNGTLLCSHHHHVIHKEHWSIQMRTGIPWFIPPPHLDPARTPRRNTYFRLE